MNILISPNTQSLGREVHPKYYPYWQEIVDLFIADGHKVTQIGIKDEEKFDSCDYIWDKSISELSIILKNYDIRISVDSFLQHLCWFVGLDCVCIFSQSDPLIYGHPENLNILKDRKYLRENQHATWNQVKYRPEAFLSAEKVYDKIKEHYKI